MKTLEGVTKTPNLRMLSPWSAPSEGEEAITEVITIIIKGNPNHLIIQGQEVGMENASFVVNLATQREIIGLTRKHKKK